MISVTIKKEWSKIRRIWWVPFVCMLVALVDYYLTLRNVGLMHGANQLWANLLFDEYVFFDAIKWVFLFSGIWFAGFQIGPECVEKRLRLLFHLPVYHHVLLYTMLGVGFTLLILLFVITTGVFWLISSAYGFPFEMTLPMYKAMVPWFIASLTSWCATAAVIADPSFLRKLCLALAGYGYFTLLTSARGFAQIDLFVHTLICIPWLLAFNAAALRVKERD